MSIGSLAALWAASMWNGTPRSRAISAMVPTSVIAPVSLLTRMSDMSAVSGRRAASTWSGAMTPPLLGFRYVASKPRVSRNRTVSKTALCSAADVTMRLPRALSESAAPLIAKLSDSVAPDVQIISLGSAPIRFATLRRAFSTAFSASRPSACPEAGLAKTPSIPKNRDISSATDGSTGVVAA